MKRPEVFLLDKVGTGVRISELIQTKLWGMGELRYMPVLVGGVFAVSLCSVSRTGLDEFCGGDVSDMLIVAGAVILLAVLYYLLEMIRISNKDF